MGGVLITPLEKDFNKITGENIIDLFREVTISKEYFEYMKSNLTDEIVKAIG